VRSLHALGGGFKPRHDIGVGLDDIAHGWTASLGKFYIGNKGPSYGVPGGILNLDDPARSS
jgi:hypothetical protein